MLRNKKNLTPEELARLREFEKEELLQLHSKEDNKIIKTEEWPRLHVLEEKRMTYLLVEIDDMNKQE